MKQQVRVGIIGMGLMGRNHARSLTSGLVGGAELSAICDVGSADAAGAYPDIPFFHRVEELLESGLIDAAIVATPHRHHVEVGRKVMAAGIHLMVEKPLAVDKSEAMSIIREAKDGVRFSVMFNLRMMPAYRKIKAMIESGELGKIQRVHWSMTRYFRTHAYYQQGGWRGTWKGEGGGVLLNQCPHQLDLWQWFFGMPDRVYAKCHFGKYHPIAVEDDVTAMLDYDGGMSGVFTASTGESPGCDRLEIHAERGRLTYEGGKLLYLRNEMEASEYSRTTDALFGRLPHWQVEIPLETMPHPHAALLTNFINSIRNDEALVSPGVDAGASLELGNAMLLSSLEGREIALPIDGEKYRAALEELISKEEAQA